MIMEMGLGRDKKQQLCWKKIKSDKLVGKACCKATFGGPFSMKSFEENPKRTVIFRVRKELPSSVVRGIPFQEDVFWLQTIFQEWPFP